MTANSGFRGLPKKPTPEETANVVNRIMTGGVNTTGTVTLDSGDSTIVTDPRVSGSSHITLSAINDDAATLMRVSNVYVAETDKAKGSFIITAVGATGVERISYNFAG